VLLGAGFISLEVAAACVSRGIETIVICSADRPHAQFGSEAFGRFLESEYRKRGVEFVSCDIPSAFIGNGKLAAVRTAAGREIATDLAIVGIGVELNSQLASEAGLDTDLDGGVVVDEFLQTTDPAIWAAGDVAAFQDLAAGRRRHVEHFLNAKWQGAAAGAGMAGERKPYERVAYAYSGFFDLHLNIRGDAQGVHAEQVLGESGSGEFVELYSDGSGKLRLTVAVSRDDDKLDRISDVAESLILKGVQATAVSQGDFQI
jgi:3-phenylpropionate/trans-cinnamate dioxygenase ferredoxin reductase subunit